jgi:copper homeostasis protein
MTIVAPPRKILEVIVTSLNDALEAEAGGADRLEVVRDLSAGGLTPNLVLVAAIRSSVSIPVRAMLRENPSMQIAGAEELEKLQRQAAAFSQLSIDGLVLGFVVNDTVDTSTLRKVSSAAPNLKITFHRAFDTLSNPMQAIGALKAEPMVDRILTDGGSGSWAARKARLQYWQQHASPQIKILFGAGLQSVSDPFIEEVHIGRAARNPPEHNAPVCRAKVAELKGLLA